MPKGVKRAYSADDNDRNTFLRNASPDDLLQYSQMKGHKEKRAFREQWKSAHVVNATGSKTESQGESRQSGTKALYEPRSRIVKKEGGDADAEVAADNYISKCIERGPPFVMWNAMTERAEFLYAKRIVNEFFKRERSLSTTGTLELDSDELAAALQNAEENGLIPPPSLEALQDLELPTKPPARAENTGSTGGSSGSGGTARDREVAELQKQLEDLKAMLHNKGTESPPAKPATPAPAPPPAVIDKTLIHFADTFPDTLRDPPQKASPRPTATKSSPPAAPPTLVPVPSPIADAPIIKEEPKAAAKAAKQTKSELDKKYMQVQGDTKKLHGLYVHAETIAQQGLVENSEWSWAATFVPAIQQALEVAKPVMKMAMAKLHMRPLAAVLKEFNESDLDHTECKQSDAWITALHSSLKEALETLESKVGPVTQMQSVNLRGTKKAKAKGAAKAASSR